MEVGHYLEITRPFRWLLALVPLFLGVSFTIRISIKFIIACISIILMQSGIRVINDYFDIELDKENERYRPLARGDISKKSAKTYALILFSIALVLGYFLNNIFFFVVVIGVIWGTLYSLPPIRLKGRFPLNHLSIGFAYALVLIIGGYSIYVPNLLNFPWITAILVSIYATFVSMIMDFSDFAGDKKYQIKKIPYYLGVDKGSKLVAAAVVLLPASIIIYRFLIYNSIKLMLGWLGVITTVYSSRNFLKKPTDSSQVKPLFLIYILTLFLFSIGFWVF